VSFSYNGVVNGTFSAEGSALDAANGENVPWAVGGRNNAEANVTIAASMPTTGAMHHIATLQIPRLTSGSSTVNVNCTPQSTCALGLFGFNVDESEDPQFLCGLESGTIILTSISEGRATGTFSGSGTCVDDALNETTFAVSGGQFDVALLSFEPALRQ
jgi:hypothetical protein